ncbi:MAG: peptidoglycan-binding protein [Alphaproteobacteria bacterium]
MSFTKTSEGRVFFKNPDNDDLRTTAPLSGTKENVAKKANGSVLPQDKTQMQILLLLKSLNTKLKDSKDSQTDVKQQLAQYKEEIKALEKKAASHENNYIDLEQKVALKQSETNKKSSRVEENVKSLKKQLETAKSLVNAIEEKSDAREASLKTIEKNIQKKLVEKKSNDDKLTARQDVLEKIQKEHNEKISGDRSAYVALTKRVNEAEARQQSLDNKIEEATSDYMKLDRKIEKALEERNRILRKVERIEQTVLETRDALNAKAMVLLTDQDAVAGVDAPQITDGMLQSDPTLVGRRMEEEALMPWWRRPVRIQGTSLVLMMVVVMLLGWIMSAAQQPAPTLIQSTQRALPPTISLHNAATTEGHSTRTQTAYERTESAAPIKNTSVTATPIYEEAAPAPVKKDTFAITQEQAPKTGGITIHKGIDNPANISRETTPLNLNNDEELLQIMESDPERVARELNKLEPSSLTNGDITASVPVTVAPVEATRPKPAPVVTQRNTIDRSAYKAALLRRISPDGNLTEIAKKIETQAFEGVPEAQHDMGAIYIAGHGKIKQDLPRAVFWFTEAGANGVANAKYNLGVLYHQGIGVKQSLDQAMALYTEAAKLGHPEAQYNLGIANIEGIGVPYDSRAAARYFEDAANKGVIEAAYNLGLIYENGLLGEVRPDEALAWYKKAADQGSPEAQSALEQLADSIGINVDDINRLVEHSRLQNAPQGNQIAQNELLYDIQSELQTLGYYSGTVDGMNGPVTRRAIADFQRENDLDVNGSPTQELLVYLRSSLEYR